jgi:SAM-dependent methyltransferase
MSDETYDDAFYRHRDANTRASARVVAAEMERFGPFRSVVDVGCGVGTWLDVWRERGAGEIFGLEGSWLDPEDLVIPRERFRHHDLTRPVELDRRFDLVVSLEVAEHLAEDRAETFVESLTRLGPVVLFSAAVPFQGGRHHVNEQWPEYWAELFDRRGYAVADPLRPRLWNDPRVRVWYAQNTLLYVAREELPRRPALAEAVATTDPHRLALVHPRLYERNSDPRRLSLRTVLRVLPHLVRGALRRRLRRP